MAGLLSDPIALQPWGALEYAGKRIEVSQDRQRKGTAAGPRGVQALRESMLEACTQAARTEVGKLGSAFMAAGLQYARANTAALVRKEAGDIMRGSMQIAGEKIARDHAFDRLRTFEAASTAEGAGAGAGAEGAAVGGAGAGSGAAGIGAGGAGGGGGLGAFGTPATKRHAPDSHFTFSDGLVGESLAKRQDQRQGRGLGEAGGPESE